jgi:hypothetical protein
MVENTNSIILEVQGSFALTYMVGFIPLNLRSQEMDKGVTLLLQLPTHDVTRRELADSWHNSARAGRLLT